MWLTKIFMLHIALISLCVLPIKGTPDYMHHLASQGIESVSESNSMEEKRSPSTQQLEKSNFTPGHNPWVHWFWKTQYEHNKRMFGTAHVPMSTKRRLMDKIGGPITLVIIVSGYDNSACIPCGKQRRTAKFDPHLARKFYDFAAAIHSDNPSGCLNAAQPDFEIDRIFSVDCEWFFIKGPVQCTGYTAVSHASKAIVLAFRGTIMGSGQFASEIVETLVMPMRRFPDSDEYYGHAVHYFREAYSEFWRNGLSRRMKKLVTQYPSYQVWLTGHSLGAALASLMGASLVWEGGNTTGIVTSNKVVSILFGSPRVGDCQYACMHDQLIDNSFRVVTSGDLISALPPNAKGLCFNDETNRPLAVHHGTEIFYENGRMGLNDFNTYSVCTGQPCNEDYGCSNNPSTKRTVEQHVTYYGVNIGDYGRSNCTLQDNSHLQLNNRPVQLQLSNSENRKRKAISLTAIGTLVGLAIGGVALVVAIWILKGKRQNDRLILKTAMTTKLNGNTQQYNTFA